MPINNIDVEFSIDLISDLNLLKEDKFDWTDKPTSLFCVIAGNISTDLSIVKKTLLHLSSLYKAVFFIDGKLEHNKLKDYDESVQKISDICVNIPNVIYMHKHVVVLNGMAFVGANCWFNDDVEAITVQDEVKLESLRIGDLGYLGKTIKVLQLHNDVKKIVVFTSTAPAEELTFKTINVSGPEPEMSLIMDTERKVVHWLFGGSEISIDCDRNNRRYTNNPKIKDQIYWPKRIVI